MPFSGQELHPTTDRAASQCRWYRCTTVTETRDIFEAQLHGFNLVPNFPTSVSKVPDHQLEHFDFFGRDADEVLKYLNLTLNLETCIHEVQVATSIFVTSQSAIVIQDPCSFFDSLLLPTLRELSINLWNVSWTAMPQLISLFSRSSLEKFTFYSNLTNRHPHDKDRLHHGIIQHPS